MAQSIASRARRPQQPEPDDVVLARALQFTEWARRNIRLIIAGAVVLVVVVGGFFWYRTDQQRRSENAAIAFLQVEQAVLTGEDAIALRELQLFIQQHGSTSYGDEARVLLGQVHLRAERPDEAVAVLRPVADRMNRSPVGVQAALLLGTALEEAGDRAGAVQSYLRVADRADLVFHQREGLARAAVLREESGDHAGAAQLYQRLVNSAEPGTPDRLIFEMRLAEAEARATQQ